MTKKELWLRLHRYHFENLVPAHLTDRVAAAFGGPDASTRAFASKLARKHGWTQRFALRAIGEYKRFAFLGVTGKGEVTPSRAIDTVWHEHILFSAAYRDFCQATLERDFDHHPELVPDDGQTVAFQAQFAATLARYRTEFGVQPPSDVWGTPKFDRARSEDDATPVFVTSGASTDEAPLHQSFDGSPDAAFGEGGGFSGGGGESSWGGSDSSGGDSAGTDSGSSDSGSSCSSSCGGGGE